MDALCRACNRLLSALGFECTVSDVRAAYRSRGLRLKKGGDRQYKTLADCATRTQALEKAALYLAELERTEGEVQGRRAPSLGAVASGIVEELYSSGAIEESTYAGYLDTMKHLTWIAEIPVDEIRREDVGDFVLSD